MKIDYKIQPEDLRIKLEKFWNLSGEKIKLIEKEYDSSKGSPVFTVGGKYTSRGWTEWTQGFQYGSAILQFDASGDEWFLNSGRRHTIEKMAPHISHTGVHDHGFNIISTYGNLLRLIRENKIPNKEWEREFYILAIKISGAVQAARWTKTIDGGFIYSFNGPHSLFVDTIRSVRVLMVSYFLGHVFQGEGDAKISLIERALQHLATTARWSVYYGEGRDRYDVRGRTAHEAIFNVNDGNFRCPNSQQGYSGFTTWTRGLAWAICGFAEELELMESLDEVDFECFGGKTAFVSLMLKAARATSDFYIENTSIDGIPYWDTGAPDLKKLDDYLQKPADPFNNYEPVDSSAAAIGAQGLLRLGNYLTSEGDKVAGGKYWQAGLTILKTLLGEPYLSADPAHQGLILHSIYHRPNGWDHIPKGRNIPCGESSMWGDYHAREVALYVQRMIDDGEYYSFI
jgi:unsaturated chondroitin disaccharide hydrolase